MMLIVYGATVQLLQACVVDSDIWTCSDSIWLTILLQFKCIMMNTLPMIDSLSE